MAHEDLGFQEAEDTHDDLGFVPAGADRTTAALPPEKGLMDHAKDALGAFTSAKSGLIKGATLGNLDPDKMSDKLLSLITGGGLKSTGLQENSQEHPIAGMAGQLAGTAVPGALMGAATAAISPAGAGIIPAAGRVALNALSGGAQGFAAKPQGEDTLSARASNAALPALAGGALSSAGETAGILKGAPAKLSGLKTTKQMNTYLDNPGEVSGMSDMLTDSTKTPEFQDKAIQAINESRKNLKSVGLEKAASLRELLQGKTLEINPNDVEGIPGAAEIVNKYRGQYGELPSGMLQVDANDANALKRLLQGASEFRPGTPYDPVQTAKMGDYAQKAAGLRRTIEGLDEGVKPINEQMQQGALLSKDLRGGLKNPISYVSTESPDKLAKIARVQDMSGGGILDLGGKMNAAKALAGKGSPSSNLMNALGEGVKDFATLPALRAMDATQKNATPTAQTLAAMLAELENQKK